MFCVLFVSFPYWCVRHPYPNVRYIALAAAEGTPGPAAMIILNRLSKLLAAKWNRKVASIRSWIQTRIAFAVMRGTSLCLRGSRQSWRKLGLYDYGWEGVRGQFL